MEHCQKQKEEYIDLIQKTYDNLFKNIKYPESCLFTFFPKNNFTKDFDFIDSDEKYTVVFKTIKPKTSVSIYKSKNMSEVSVLINEIQLVETDTIIGFDNALNKVILRIEYLNV
tara:strand:- start:1059 stop:1400 length:342 start_codon:yes stop_codon:yes gene_type:complete